MKRALKLLVSLALVSITLAACGGGGSGAGSVAKPDKLTLVGAVS